VTGRANYGSNVTYVPSFRIIIAGNSPIEISPIDAAVLRSIHAFKMPSTFLDAGDPRIGNNLCYEKVPDLHSRFRQRRYALALLLVLAEYYQMYLLAENAFPTFTRRRTVFTRQSPFIFFGPRRTFCNRVCSCKVD